MLFIWTTLLQLIWKFVILGDCFFLGHADLEASFPLTKLVGDHQYVELNFAVGGADADTKVICFMSFQFTKCQIMEGLPREFSFRDAYLLGMKSCVNGKEEELQWNHHFVVGLYFLQRRLGFTFQFPHGFNP